MTGGEWYDIADKDVLAAHAKTRHEIDEWAKERLGFLGVAVSEDMCPVDVWCVVFAKIQEYQGAADGNPGPVFVLLGDIKGGDFPLGADRNLRSVIDMMRGKGQHNNNSERDA